MCIEEYFYVAFVELCHVVNNMISDMNCLHFAL